MTADPFSCALDYHRQHALTADSTLRARVVDARLRRVVVSSAPLPGACWAWVYAVAESGDVWPMAIGCARWTREEAEAAALADLEAGDRGVSP